MSLTSSVSKQEYSKNNRMGSTGLSKTISGASMELPFSPTNNLMKKWKTF